MSVVSCGRDSAAEDGTALDGRGGRGVMAPRRFAALAAVSGTLALAGWGAAGFDGFGSFGIENPLMPIGDRGATHGATCLRPDTKSDAALATAMASAAAVATADREPPACTVVPAAVSGA